MFEFIKKLFGIKQEEVAVVVETAKNVKKRVKKIADVNNDNIVNLEDVKEVKRRVTKKVKEVADVNKDGVVNIDDVKEAVKSVSKRIKKPSAEKTLPAIDEMGLQPAKNSPQMPNVKPLKQPQKKRGRKPKAK